MSDIPSDYLHWLLREEVMKTAWWEQQIQQELELRANLDARMRTPPDRVIVSDAVRRWFSRAALRYHPDRGGSNEAMKIVNALHEDLRRELERTQ